MSLINSKNIKRLMLLIISLLTAIFGNIASNVLRVYFSCGMAQKQVSD